MTEPDLTEEMIATAMAKADAWVCVGSDRCYAFPDRLEDARPPCTPKGRCKVGWIVSREQAATSFFVRALKRQPSISAPFD